MIDTTDRHPSTQQVARWFTSDHYGANHPGLAVALSCEDLAARLIDNLPDGPELTAGLRHLLEAKDAFVRAAVANAQEADQ